MMVVNNTMKFTRKLCFPITQIGRLPRFFSSFSISTRNSHNGGNIQNGEIVETVLTRWTKKFQDNSISEARESVEQIIAFCLNTNQVSEVYKTRKTLLSSGKIAQIEELCKKRLKQMPVQYVIGEWDFRCLNLSLRPPVFIPRPETEQLVDLALEEIDRLNCDNILELCCGSGPIALSLLHERPSIVVTAVDQSPAACLLTMENAQKHKLNKRLDVIQSQINDLPDFLINRKFGVIVSNPPYIFSEDMASLQGEIQKYEDLQALDGGTDGLDVIKSILKISAQLLNRDGKLLLEVDPRHPALLRNYLKAKSCLGLIYSRDFTDFAGKARFVSITKM